MVAAFQAMRDDTSGVYVRIMAIFSSAVLRIQIYKERLDSGKLWHEIISPSLEAFVIVGVYNSWNFWCDQKKLYKKKMTLDVDGETPLTKKDLEGRRWSNGQGAKASRFGGWNTDACELHDDLSEEADNNRAAAAKSTAHVDASAAGSNNGTVPGSHVLINLHAKNDNEYFSKRVFEEQYRIEKQSRKRQFERCWGIRSKERAGSDTVAKTKRMEKKRRRRLLYDPDNYGGSVSTSVLGSNTAACEPVAVSGANTAASEPCDNIEPCTAYYAA